MNHLNFPRWNPIQSNTAFHLFRGEESPSFGGSPFYVLFACRAIPFFHAHVSKTEMLEILNSRFFEHFPGTVQRAAIHGKNLARKPGGQYQPFGPGTHQGQARKAAVSFFSEFPGGPVGGGPDISSTRTAKNNLWSTAFTTASALNRHVIPPDVFENNKIKANQKG
jgi:hypothetical protein